MFLKDHRKMGYATFLIYTLVYVFKTLSPFQSIGYVLLSMSFILLILHRFKLASLKFFWLPLVVFFFLDIADDWTGPSNHHYLLFYLSVLFFLKQFRMPDDNKVLYSNIKWIAGLSLLFAGMQKVLSPSYLDGRLLEFLFVNGDLAAHSIFRSINGSTAVQINHEIYKELYLSDPNLGGSIQLQLLENFKSEQFSILAQLSVVIEFIVGLALLSYPTKVLTHLLFLATIVGIFILRPECGFLCVLCSMGLFLTPPKKILQLTYALLFLLFLLLIILNKGLL